MQPAPSAKTDPDPTSWPYVVLDEICARVDADASDARLIKFTNNAVLALPSSRLVVRIDGSTAVGRSARKVVEIAGGWRPTTCQPSDSPRTCPSPFTSMGMPSCIWHLIPDTGRCPTGRDIGDILRRFHSLPGAPENLPSWSTLGLIRSRLETSDVLTHDEHAFLTSTTDAIAADLERATAVTRQRGNLCEKGITHLTCENPNCSPR